ncbi:secretion protein EspA [Chromobacterium vaccinii]|uniref:Secretion protein EspA n=1 Tax=Chromobacterium vaccinii TaxID=1108595 RepID=A0A1D9LLL6_9NEIS|nr:secretion protein EspA [Chromobacterium vaccinii]AOZ52124.1 secretion protein EspA [Chromobacterium vaccinii]QND86231.1 EspA-like secreted protein [Chromobacterium vaccinii]QND91462.1 EspA-like secreted protein [Chromobacterium vaccinii]SUX56094.1 Secretion system effector B [Chromobacterium vaccinii]
MSFATNFATSNPIASSTDYENYVDNKAGQGDSIMSQGISVLYKFMTLFSDLAQGKYDQMSAKADRARNSQQAANQVDAIISKLAKADDKGDLPPEVIQYLKDHHISITVQNDGTNSTSDIMAYLKSIGHEDGKGLDKGQLDVIKGALDADSGRCSDFVTQAQLQIQKTMQSYNVCVSLINSMQSLLAEMNKSIAQNIR